MTNFRSAADALHYSLRSVLANARKKDEGECPTQQKVVWVRKEEQVWLLWFEQDGRTEEEEDTELLIGIYRTEAEAREAILPLLDQPGFRDFKEGFNVYPRTVGPSGSGWRSGFIRD